MKRISGCTIVSAIVVLMACLFLVSPVSHAKTYRWVMGAGPPMGKSGGNYVFGTWFAQTLAERIKEATGDDVKWTFAWGGAIAGVGDEVTALQQGALTFAPINYMFETAKLPMGSVWYQIPFCSPDIHLMNQIAYDLHQDIPYMQEALEKYNVKYIANSGWDSYQLITNFPIHEVTDLKEHKVAGAGPNLEWIKAAGAVPVQASLMEVYTSLSTGVFEGYISATTWMVGFAFHEVAKYVTFCDFGSLPATSFGMNLSVFKSLPKEIQDIILELGAKVHVKCADSCKADVSKAIEAMKQKGVQFYQLSEEQKKQWAKNLPDIPARWVKEYEGKGYPAKQIINYIIDAQKKAGYQFPRDWTVD